MKPGANKSDLNQIRKMAAEGVSIEEISRVVRIYPDIVEKLIVSHGFKKGDDVRPKAPPLAAMRGEPEADKPAEKEEKPAK